MNLISIINLTLYDWQLLLIFNDKREKEEFNFNLSNIENQRVKSDKKGKIFWKCQ